MPRFVLLVHDHPTLHWDFMLEEPTALKTWRLNALPNFQSRMITAELLASHRLAYLDYEGPVSGERGTVQRIDRGEYQMIRSTNDLLEFELCGDILLGRAELCRQSTSKWLFQWSPRSIDV